MGLNRLSRTGLAKRPFYIKSTGLGIWSVEELCWFISRNLPLIDEEIAGEKLTRWLTEEFRMTSCAIRMEKGAAEKEGKTAGFLLPLFTDTGYFTAPELKKFSAMLSEMESAPMHERYLRKAEALLRNGLYGEAMEYYRRAEEAAGTADREFLSRAAKGRGAAAACMLEYEEALKDFRKALEECETRENLKLYLTALRLTRPAEKFAAEAEEAGADEEMLGEIDAQIYSAMEKQFDPPEDPGMEIRRLREEYHRESGS